jgi:DNA recombination protein RmuC
MIYILLGALVVILTLLVFIWRLSLKNNALKQTLELERQNTQNLTQVFRGLSQEALLSNNHHFIELAKSTFEKLLDSTKEDMSHRQKQVGSLVEPIQKALAQVDEKIGLLEKERIAAYVDLKRQVGDLLTSQLQLKTETANLVKALRTPTGRGQWGEMQLKRVVEMAGMINHCDFIEQGPLDEGRLRPDMIINLPGSHHIVVDAKTPLMAYLESLETEDDLRKAELLGEHAQQVRKHVKLLSQRSYWEQFEKSPDFVIMFLPGEAFFSAALERDPSLIEYGVKEKVILATPTTLIALLRAVAFGWRQESLAENAKVMGELGRELYKRLSDMTGHLSRLGKSVNGAVENYNAAVGTFERRVLVTARKFQEMDSSLGHETLSPLPPIDSQTRPVHAEESDYSTNPEGITYDKE